ncbi:outer membrane beta-barrel protein [soil metagenome]
MTPTARYALAGVAALALAAGASASSAQSMFGYSGPATWTGPYVGVFGGAVIDNDQDDETLRFDRNLDGNFGDPVTTAAAANAFGPGFCGGFATGNAQPLGCYKDKTGDQAGIRAGYDYQIGSFVVGIVGDVQAIDHEDSVTGFSTTPASYVFTRSVESMAAVRARLGYAFGPALVYGTAGAAYAKVDNRFFTTNGMNTFTETADDDKANGYQAGGGLEFALAPHLSLTAEYLYTSLDAGDYVVRVGQGTAAATNPFVLAPNTTGTDIIRSNSRIGMHAVNIGMSYRF